MTLRAIRRAVLAALLLLPFAPALAQSGAPPAEVERARAMIFDGAPAAALDLLRPLAEGAPGDTDAWFFRGMAAAAVAAMPPGGPGAPADDAARRSLLDEAVASYRHVVELQPDLAGARLELARVLFQRGRCLAEPDDLLEHLLGDDCDAAAHHFRRALAGGLPPEIAEAVSRFLGAVRARKRVSGSFGVSVAPDSNVNTGTSTRRIPSRLRNFFTGERLVFELDERALATSGVGLFISASGEYRHPVPFRLLPDGQTRLRLGGGLSRREYRKRRFDDMTLALHAGPQVLLPRAHVSLLAKADRRWYGGDPVSHGIGPRLEGGVSLGERLWLNAGVEWIQRRHRSGRNSDGPRSDLDFNLAFEPTPAVTFGLRGGWQRTRARVRSQRSRTNRVGMFARADLPPVLGVSGFELGFFHDLLLTRYDSFRVPLFSPDNRQDSTWISRLTASNDQLEMFGFVPVLSLVQEQRNSNIGETYDYRRYRGELSLRRLF